MYVYSAVKTFAWLCPHLKNSRYKLISQHISWPQQIRSGMHDICLFTCEAMHRRRALRLWSRTRTAKAGTWTQLAMLGIQPEPKRNIPAKHPDEPESIFIQNCERNITIFCHRSSKTRNRERIYHEHSECILIDSWDMKNNANSTGRIGVNSKQNLLQAHFSSNSHSLTTIMCCQQFSIPMSKRRSGKWKRTWKPS